jgi:3D-(3,5/4)-trihydroxycyclohexane-1,2-dione acylhydrolase (decyclizing)
VVETQAGKSALPWDHPLNFGPVGVTGAASANAVCETADLVIGVGTRFQDFTTGSWALFKNPAQAHPRSTCRPMTPKAWRDEPLIRREDRAANLGAALGSQQFKTRRPGVAKTAWFAADRCRQGRPGTATPCRPTCR